MPQISIESGDIEQTSGNMDGVRLYLFSEDTSSDGDGQDK